MFFTKASWQRYQGQTEWKTVPGQGIVHTVCGREITQFTQMRTIWEDGPGPCAGTGEVKPVSLLQCTHCHGEPRPVKHGDPIPREELVEIPR